MSEVNYPLPPELRGVVDEYDRHRNAEVLEDYEELFAVLRQWHRQYPDWRFGQLITNLAAWSGKTREGNPYDVPDERLLETAQRLLVERQTSANSNRS